MGVVALDQAVAEATDQRSQEYSDYEQRATLAANVFAEYDAESVATGAHRPDCLHVRLRDAEEKLLTENATRFCEVGQRLDETIAIRLGEPMEPEDRTGSGIAGKENEEELADLPSAVKCEDRFFQRKS